MILRSVAHPSNLAPTKLKQCLFNLSHYMIYDKIWGIETN